MLLPGLGEEGFQDVAAVIPPVEPVQPPPDLVAVSAGVFTPWIFAITRHASRVGVGSAGDSVDNIDLFFGGLASVLGSVATGKDQADGMHHVEVTAALGVA